MNKDDILLALRHVAMGRSNTPLLVEFAEKLEKVLAEPALGVPESARAVLHETQLSAKDGYAEAIGQINAASKPARKAKAP